MRYLLLYLPFPYLLHATASAPILGVSPMPLISPAETETLLNGVTPLGEDFEIGRTPYPLVRLTPEQFELLLYELAKTSAPPGVARFWDDAVLMLRGADGGKDVLLRGNAAIVGVVQCKRLESAMSRPEVLREIVKTILFSREEGVNLAPAGEFTYFLALTTDPSGPVIELFGDPATSRPEVDKLLPSAVTEVIERYKTLAHLDEAVALADVQSVLEHLKLKLLRPNDIDRWVDSQRNVAERFFRHRVVIDNSAVQPMHAELMDRMRRIEASTAGVPFITDVDLKMISERTTGVPESHRLSIGVASLFGFPREMFEGADALNTQMRPLIELLVELKGSFIDWMFGKSLAMAMTICDEAEVCITVHPVARQIPAAFLGQVVSEALQASVIGNVMSSILEGLSPLPPPPRDDEEKLAALREHFLQEALRYVGSDFSGLAGTEEIVELKKKVIAHMIQGLGSEADIRSALDRGIATLRRWLFPAAAELRRLGSQPISIFLSGTGGLDSPDAFRRMAESFSAKKAQNGGSKVERSRGK